MHEEALEVSEIGFFSEGKLDNIRVNYFRKCKSTNSHAFAIGLIGVWWIDNFGGKIEESKKIMRYFPDISLMDKKGNVIGIAEVENKDYYLKLEHFKEIDKNLENPSTIEFYFLFTWFHVNVNGSYSQRKKRGKEEFERLLNWFSKNTIGSGRKWILFIEGWMNPAESIGCHTFEYHIFQNGKRTNHKRMPFVSEFYESMKREVQRLQERL